jgi:tellurite resistance protein TerC
VSCACALTPVPNGFSTGIPLATIGPEVGFVAVIAVVALLLVDLKLFARGREPSFGEAVRWSIGWLALSLLVALGVLAVENGDAAVNYITVYLIERSLSLDNLFVFLLLFGYFAVPPAQRARLLFWGIVAALAVRGVAILGGVALIERFHFVIYVLGAGLLVLAYRMLRGVAQHIDPDRNLFVRVVRRLMPVTSGYREHRWFVREGSVRQATPLLLAFVSVVVADIAFAIDSIPAAFAITTDALVIWLGNAFALLGLRALFVLVEGLRRRFRYLDQTIASVLSLVAVKLLLQDVVEIGAPASLGLVAAAFAIGITASLLADRRGEAPALRESGWRSA